MKQRVLCLRERISGEQGVSLTELLVASAMSLIVLAAALTLYETQIANLDFVARQSETLSQTRVAIDHIARHVRQADSPSETIHPVITALPREMAFYEDVDRDGELDKVRYFVRGRVVYYGVTAPDEGSSPPTYLRNPEQVTPLLNSLKTAWTGNVFTYYSNDDPSQVLQPSETDRIAAVQVTLHSTGGPASRPDSATVSTSTWVKIRSVFNNLD